LDRLVAEEFALELLDAFVHAGAAASVDRVDLLMGERCENREGKHLGFGLTFVNIKAVPPADNPKPIATARQKSPRKVPPTVPLNCSNAVNRKLVKTPRTASRLTCDDSNRSTIRQSDGLQDHQNQLKEENEEEQHEVRAAVVLEGFVSRAVPAKDPDPISPTLTHKPSPLTSRGKKPA
jgi:hypothetical protein